MNRRDFLSGALALAGLTLSGDIVKAAETGNGGMIYRTLGKTGRKVSAIGLGGFHIGKQKEEQESIQIIRSAIDRGITFLDNCWDYHGGESERRMGKALQGGYRAKVFVMTKIDGRTKEAATKQIDESLKRLQTDHVDLLQIHEVIRMEDPDRLFGDGGGMQAIKAAQKAGKIRFVGFTGHKDPAIHLKMIQVAEAHDFHFDTAQMPLNVMDAHFKSFQDRVVPELVKRNMGVLGMKPLGDHYILQSKAVSAIECLHYSLNLPTSVVITGIDSMQILDQAIEAAQTFKPLNKEQMSRLLARTAPLAAEGKYELYKTSTHFDGTTHNPQWLG